MALTRAFRARRLLFVPARSNPTQWLWFTPSLRRIIGLPSKFSTTMSTWPSLKRSPRPIARTKWTSTARTSHPLLPSCLANRAEDSVFACLSDYAAMYREKEPWGSIPGWSVVLYLQHIIWPPIGSDRRGPLRGSAQSRGTQPGPPVEEHEDSDEYSGP